MLKEAKQAETSLEMYSAAHPNNFGSAYLWSLYFCLAGHSGTLAARRTWHVHVFHWHCCAHFLSCIIMYHLVSHLSAALLQETETSHKSAFETCWNHLDTCLGLLHPLLLLQTFGCKVGCSCIGTVCWGGAASAPTWDFWVNGASREGHGSIV